MRATSNWPAIWVAYLAGVIGAVQVGRVAPAVEAIATELAMDLPLLGWAVSLITLASALGGLLAGMALPRVGAKRLLILGLVILALSVGLSAFAPTVVILLVLRAVEGLGYLLIVVAAPTLMATLAAPQDAPRALALWGTFFTLGLSIAAFLGGWTSNALGWRPWFLANVALLALVLPALLWLLPKDQGVTPEARRESQALPAAIWLLGFGFLGMTLSALAIMSMLPPYLIAARALSPSVAGSTTGLVALMSIFGSLLYGLTEGRVRPGPVPLALGLLVLTVFPAFWAGIPAPFGLIAAGAAVACTGVLVAHVFASVPRLVGREALIGPANGLVAQIGSIGALLGPPLVGLLVEAMGWMALASMVALCALGFWVLTSAAERARPSD